MMGPSIDLKSSFLESLEMRGISGPDGVVYQQMLSELAMFLEGRSPRHWNRRDFEAFLRQRARELSATEIAAYGIGLGILTEIIEKSIERNVDLDLELDLQTSSQLPAIAADDTLLPGQMYNSQ